MQDPDPKPPASPGPNIDELVFECLERMERDGDWESALNEICAANPEHEQALRDSVRALHETGLIETTFFPRPYAKYCDLLGQGGPYLLWGLVEEQFDAITVTVERVERVERVKRRSRVLRSQITAPYSLTQKHLPFLRR